MSYTLSLPAWEYEYKYTACEGIVVEVMGASTVAAGYMITEGWCIWFVCVETRVITPL